MSKNENKFIYLKWDVNISDGISVEKNDVGIIEPEAKDNTVFMVRIWQNIIIKPEDYVIFEVDKTGDQYPSKICNICHKLLDTTEFAKNQNGKNNRSVRRPSCQECRKGLEGSDMPSSEKTKWSKLRPYKVPFECPICGKRTIAGVTSTIVLDHNHKNGTFRGFICDSCNTGIGRFKDDTELLKKAIKHLE